MKIRNVIMSLMAIALIWACGKDEDPAPPKNTPPVIAAKTFSVPENIAAGTAIGTVTATDADKDALTFSISTNDNNLFAITKAGVLSLASGKSLDFATKAQHVITVAVSDGEASASAKVTINVTKVDPENLAPTIEAQQFEAIESISDTETIGTVAATDPEDDTLGFAIAVNDNDLFEIDPLTGELSLAEGMKLNFDAAQEHTITIGVSDGNGVSTADMTIKVIEDLVPTGIAQEFSVVENIDDTEVIGAVVAEDPEGQPLTFTIVTNDSDLFEITADGELSLAPGMGLDFETVDHHNIVVGASDGFKTTNINVTVLVEDDGLMSDDPTSFVTTWTIPNDNFNLTIGLFGSGYDFTIDWGDGTIEDFVTDAGTISHDYALADNYTVAIQGIFPAISMGYFLVPEESRAALSSIKQWGNIAWSTFYYAFLGCSNMIYNATDVPDLTSVTEMSLMFNGASSFNGNIGNWDVSNVTNMSLMFNGASSFNGNIGNWDVSNVTDMSLMFFGATSFNQDLSGWKNLVGNVIDMSGMFYKANAFNQDIGDWDVSNVEYMHAMFDEAESFNQNLADWKIGNVADMSNMLDNSGMSPQNLNATLIGWNNFVETNNGPDGITLGLDNLAFCGQEAIDAANNLDQIHGWTFAGNFFVEPVCP